MCSHCISPSLSSFCDNKSYTKKFPGGVRCQILQWYVFVSTNYSLSKNHKRHIIIMCMYRDGVHINYLCGYRVIYIHIMFYVYMHIMLYIYMHIIDICIYIYIYIYITYIMLYILCCMYIYILCYVIYIICLTFHWPPCDTPHCPLSSLPSWSPAPGFRSPAASRTQRRRQCPAPDKVPGGCWREDISWIHVNSKIETRKYSQTYMYWLYWFLQIAQYLIWCEEFSENVEENYKNLEKQDMKGTVLLGVWFSALYPPKKSMGLSNHFFPMTIAINGHSRIQQMEVR